MNGLLLLVVLAVRASRRRVTSSLTLQTVFHYFVWKWALRPGSYKTGPRTAGQSSNSLILLPVFIYECTGPDPTSVDDCNTC